MLLLARLLAVVVVLKQTAAQQARAADCLRTLLGGVSTSH